MEHRFLNEAEVAEHLNLSAEDIQQRVKSREIPFETRGKRHVFDKDAIDVWASKRILNFSEGPLAEYHQKSTRGTAAFLAAPAILPQMIEPGFIAPALPGKTKASILRELVELADRTGRVNDRKALLENLEAREKTSSTALPGGFALPHPGSHDDYMFESSFIVVGRALQPINFGGPDGEPTNLFFLICCQDDRLHLHVLARLCLMAQKTELIAQLNAAPDAAAILNSLLTSELETLRE